LIVPGRRGFLSGTGKLSAVAVAMLAGKEVLAASHAGAPMDSKDVDILNVALGLEWEGINAYTLGAQSGLLQKPVLDTAVRFQADHKEHADTLGRRDPQDGRQAGRAEIARRLRQGAQGRHAQEPGRCPQPRRAPRARRDQCLPRRHPAFRAPALAQVAARLAADEVMHWTILNNALGRPLPAGGMPFGA
jgi:hypothetical protein